MTNQNVRVVKEYTHRVGASKERVFPLLCPELEIDWLEGWSYEMVYSKSGVAELDCVFRTDLPDKGKAVWVVSEHDPKGGRIQFVINYSDTHVERLEIRVREIDTEVTELVWRRTYTSINEQGKELIGNLTGSDFSERMDFLAASLDHYCRTGSRLSFPTAKQTSHD